MIKKKFALSVVCASMVALTGCSDDETTVYQDTPETLAKVQALESENATLETQNTDLSEQNVELVAEVAYWKEQEGEPYNLVTQCATADIHFDFVDPNSDEAQASASIMATGGDDCMSCHNYTDGGESGVIPPHSDLGDCANCHDGHSDGGEEPIVGNPTDPTFTQPTFNYGVRDGKTGASGPTWYTPGSYLNADWLVKAINKQVYNYRWTEANAEEGQTGVTELAAACGLENREHMTEMFPNDGKAYVIEEKKNNNGTQLFATVNKFEDNGEQVETPNIAVFGWSMDKDETTGDYYATGTISANNTCQNIIMNGEARLTYYEYDPTQFTKTGLEEPSRNRGARILLSTDYVGTQLIENYPSAMPGFETGTDFKPEDVEWDRVAWCGLKMKVESIIPLG
ncbi:hypothetical protein [Shewanella sp. 10N.286.54.B9]|uniref:hypothetical protein n=1 Tax=Shewanella sp. 10N.286.54.B9 TaxID=3229719 RepID=UPI00354EF893